MSRGSLRSTIEGTWHALPPRIRPPDLYTPHSKRTTYEFWLAWLYQSRYGGRLISASTSAPIITHANGHRGGAPVARPGLSWLGKPMRYSDSGGIAYGMQGVCVSQRADIALVLKTAMDGGRGGTCRPFWITRQSYMALLGGAGCIFLQHTSTSRRKR
ncbi:hypothetical protein SAMD00023353_4700880 [Rosellinia necatrix]|uniref:Uncharacterized protein n=1 Tax=Rosellinia necatrix TaxID=77044 RepID=A0A1W2TQU3_ROSNE|nr:hypothetical protein SAMD00023353_4700880 [Rosellinia necatrix]